MRRSRKANSEPVGSPDTSGEPRFLTVGQILRPHGLSGELLMRLLTEFPERLDSVDTVYVGEDRRPFRLEAIRRQGENLRLKLSGVEDRNAAEAFRAQSVTIALADPAELPPGRYYHHQIEGLQVVTEVGEPLGRITEILETGANDVYVVQGERGEILLPAIKSVIREVDLENGRMIVHLMEGLI